MNMMESKGKKISRKSFINNAVRQLSGMCRNTTPAGVVDMAELAWSIYMGSRLAGQPKAVEQCLAEAVEAEAWVS